jgi:predicted nuclease of predicted toxin-antitoxin system
VRVLLDECLLDECLPARLKRALLGHSVKTVPEAGWCNSKDGPLLKFAERNFDVSVTIDQKMQLESAGRFSTDAVSDG